MNKKLLISIFSLLLLSFFIAMTSDFSAGALSDGKIIEIRMEDILIAVLLVVWVFSFKEKKPVLFTPIVAWLTIGLLSTVINLFLGHIGIVRSFFYFLKEVEFFAIFFYVYFHTKEAKIIINFWIVLMFLNFLYVVYQIIFPPLVGEYGTAALSEWGVFPTGSFFLISFAFLFNVFLHYHLNLDISKWKKALLGLAVISPSMGIFGSGSKACLLGFMLVVLVSLGFLIYKRRSFKPVILILALAVVFTLSVMTIPRVKTMFYIFSPVNMVKEFVRERGEVMITTLKVADRKGFNPLLGLGKSSVTEAHNQFVRNYVETGIFGSLAFIILIVLLIKIPWKGLLTSTNNFSIGLSAGLLTATVAMLFLSMSAEVFIVVKPAEVFWFFAGLTLAVLHGKQN